MHTVKKLSLMRTTSSRIAYSAALLLSVGSPFAASAQVTPGSVPQSALPTRNEQQFKTPDIQPQAPAGDVTPQISIPQTAVAGKLAQQFTLKSVELQDMTVYKQQDFQGLYSGKLGQTITLADAREIARSVTARYRADGYVLSQAVIPNQDLKSGVLHIRVVEGFVNKVYVENDRNASDRRHLIEGYAQQINKMRPLNTKTLERYMLLISDLPGVTARAIIRPSPDTFGAADLVIKVSNKVFEGSFTSDNRGNKFIGPYQEQLTLTENSAVGLGERTTIRGINTIPWQELHFFDVQHEEQLGHDGTKVTLLYSHAMTHPGDILKPLDLKGTSEEYAVTLSHPFLRSRAQNLTGRLTFDARDTDSNALGTQLSRDRVRALRLGGTYDTGDKWGGVDLADAVISQGTPWFGATDDNNTSRPGASDHFTKGNLSLSRIQTLPKGFSVLTAAEGQYSSRPLFTSEQFTLGGVGFGQAYDSGEVAGDSGIAGKIELRFGQEPGYRFFDSYQLYTYYDVGSAWVNNNAPGVKDEFSLASAGVGIRSNFNANLYGYAEVAFPLTRDVASENDSDPTVLLLRYRKILRNKLL